MYPYIILLVTLQNRSGQKLLYLNRFHFVIFSYRSKRKDVICRVDRQIYSNACTVCFILALFHEMVTTVQLENAQLLGIKSNVLHTKPDPTAFKCGSWITDNVS